MSRILVIGDRLLTPIDLLAGVRPIVRHHHERWDGTGYPDELAREDIPVCARVVETGGLEVVAGQAVEAPA